MQVVIDKNAGFCWGVVRAIEIAESELNASGKLYSLGEIIHNPVEVERLKEKGLVTISHNDLKNVKDAKVLIRAHGEPPSTYELRRNTVLRSLMQLALLLRSFKAELENFILMVTRL